MSENYKFSETGEGADIPHTFRYYLARGFVEPADVVLDVACGWGGGSEILARSRASEVHGLDYREDCITHATAQNINHKVSFKQFDLNKGKELPQSTYSVTIETIEHLKDPQKFADMQKLHTRDRIFVTTPIVKTKEDNEHHLHDFTVNDIVRLYQDDDWKLFHRAEHGDIYGIFFFEKR